MRSTTTEQFRRELARLPAQIRLQARTAYRQFKDDPDRPGLELKKVAPGVWSVRIGLHYRALAYREGDRATWFWIGTHAEYDACSAPFSSPGR